MINFFNITKFIFHTLNIFLIIFYLFPGSLLGLLLYDNIRQQPQLTPDLFIVSSNHFYAFSLLTMIGILSYSESIKINFILKYLFILSLIIEFFHIIIPNRSFQLGDLLGNILGFIVIFFLHQIWKKIK
tara:strand:+ start:106 stop:492 length:387 start_codon:yes stop_codon:yes gene_type:complete